MLEFLLIQSVCSQKIMIEIIRGKKYQDLILNFGSLVQEQPWSVECLSWHTDASVLNFICCRTTHVTGKLHWHYEIKFFYCLIYGLVLLIQPFSQKHLKFLRRKLLPEFIMLSYSVPLHSVPALGMNVIYLDVSF